MQLFVIFAVLTFAAGVSLASALGPEPDAAGQPVLVLAPPWGQGAAAIVAATGGRVVGPVTAPFGALAVFAVPRPGPGLRARGAWSVHDAGVLASFCGASS
ncbi:hypothetical protein [Salipiger sp.]|uniref:hypothetical protein n=1 Tax=Salipiger sp. TaxID=2078585 RepID=UPI003A9796BD